MVLLLPPAPAALVLLGRAFATLSALSAAAFLLIAVAGPPGAFGDDGRAVVLPVDGEPGVLTGDDARGEDCEEWSISLVLESAKTRNDGKEHAISLHARSSSVSAQPSGVEH